MALESQKRKATSSLRRPLVCVVTFTAGGVPAAETELIVLLRDMLTV